MLTRTLRCAAAALLGAGALAAAPLAAQGTATVDPNDFAIDGDLQEQPGELPVYSEPRAETQADEPVVFSETPSERQADYAAAAPSQQVAPSWSDPNESVTENVAQQPGSTYGEDDLIGAAEGVFGRGAEGLARMIQDVLKNQGQPNAYIVGREAGGAFILGARYGSGTLHHRIEGNRKVYWTGPSIGFDAGANAANTFVLVYNLYDSEELYERYPAGEGQLYVVGGLTASYLRKGDVVLIPIRMGAGLRLGVNAGYMRFSKKQRWVPF